MLSGHDDYPIHQSSLPVSETSTSDINFYDRYGTRQHLHVQAVCDARYLSPDGATEHGMGILEQLVIGEHPTGLTGVFDAYQPTGGPPAGPSQR